MVTRTATTAASTTKNSIEAVRRILCRRDKPMPSKMQPVNRIRYRQAKIR